MLVFIVIDTIKDAATILALAGMYGGPGGAVTVPSLYMLRKAFIDQQMGAACAVGIVLMLIVFLLQKLLNNFTDWREVSARQRLVTRSVMVLLAGGIYAGLHAPLLAMAALLPAVPWSAGLERLRMVRFSPAPAAAGETFPTETTVGESNPAAVQLAAITQSGRPASIPATGGEGRPPAGGGGEARAGVGAKSRASRGLGAMPRHLFLWGILALAYLPLYLMLIVSLKDNQQFYDAPAVLTPPFHWGNWAAAWSAVIPSLANSIFITTSSTALTLVLALGGSYFFARVKVPGSTFLWNALLVLMMMPTIANLVPLFRLLIDLRLANTLTALVAVGTAGGQVFAIFMLRNFIADLPQALFEAAEIDGASHLRQLITIVAPLCAPILGVIGVMHAIGQWNEFLLPLIIIRDQSRLPVMVQLLRMAGEYIKLWGPLMAGYALASLPIIALFIASMRLFTRGLTEGAVKG
jgi:ABC-type glycerol-3-phosphate transport system permease component